MGYLRVSVAREVGCYGAGKMMGLPKAFMVVWLACLAVGVGLAASFAPGAGKLSDFRSLRAAGYMVVHEPGRLYDLREQEAVQEKLDPPGVGVLPFYHVSYEALWYAPFAAMGARAAFACSVGVNMLLLLAAVLCARTTFSRVVPLWQPRAGLAAFLFVPFYRTLLQGQDSLLLLLICCMALRLLERERDGWAGAVLALALFKFQIALPLLVLIAVRRGWRVVAGFVPSAGVVLGGSALLVGWRGVADLRALLAGSSLAGDAGDAAQQAMAIHPAAMPNLMGLVFTVLGGRAPSGVAFGVVMVVSAGVMVLGMLAVRRVRTVEEAFGVAVVCAVLVSYHLYLHDLTLLLVPLCLWGGDWAGVVLFVAPVGLVLFAPGFLCWLAVPVLGLLVESGRVWASLGRAAT